MYIRFHRLELKCRKATEKIEFSPRISFFHGEISTGKSSIVRLIDFCLGGKLEETPAIQQELVSASLVCSIGENNVLIEREKGAPQAQVTWDGGQDQGTLLLPAKAGKALLYGENVYGLSDFLFYLLGMTPPMVLKSKTQETSSQVRLGFRDIMRLCYLEQDNLDSSFFELEQPIIREKSKDAFNLVFGFHSASIIRLEARLSETKTERLEKERELSRLREFLEEFEIASEEDLRTKMRSLKEEIESTKQEIKSVRSSYREETHFADTLRSDLAKLSQDLFDRETSLRDLTVRLDHEKSLRAEMISSSIKLDRAQKAKAVLSGVTFKRCPCCGALLKRKSDDDSCVLCTQDPHDDDPSGKDVAIKTEVASRVAELTDSIERHERAITQQRETVERKRRQKAHFDKRLNEELSEYDSQHFAMLRENERRLGSLEAEISNLERLIKMPAALQKIGAQIDDLKTVESKLTRDIDTEKGKLKTAAKNVRELETLFAKTLLRIGFPAFTKDDSIEISEKTWFPYIVPFKHPEQRWTFSDAGSGGKKTLLNVCYALAIHETAAVRNLQIPSFLIIDSPMKNIGIDVNKEIFQAFYEHLYELASGHLKNTQFIIVDNEYINIKHPEIDIIERFMSDHDPNYPPLISYYRGH